MQTSAEMKTMPDAQTLRANAKARLNLPLVKLTEFIALLMMGVELGVSYSHMMQLPGKLQLSLSTFIAVQTVLIKYKVGLGIVEMGSVITMVAILLLVPFRSRKFYLVLCSLVLLVLAFAVWGVFIEPINVYIDSWTTDSYPSDWNMYRERWHFLHLVRLLLLTCSTSSLVAAALILGGYRSSDS